LKPFNSIDQLIERAIACFSKVRPVYGEYLDIMHKEGFLDLESRKGKAPGGFNYPLFESNIPFIFMNATHNLRDFETMMHEGGHAIHAFLCKDIRITQYKETPPEIAELASMSMELISMEHWDVVFQNQSELNRAKKTQLEGVLAVLPWIATVDRFQHWLYTHPEHSVDERLKAWEDIFGLFQGQLVDWDGYQDYLRLIWQKQLHIFEIPFYYIEYGIAQLGAIALWRNYKQNPAQALDQYESALSLGYSKPIPDIYQVAGIEFNFSVEYIKELMDFVKAELARIPV